MHEYGPVILLFLGILGGIWLNRRDFADLKVDMNRQFAETKAETNRQFAELRADMTRQFTDTNRRIDRIEDDRKIFHNVTGRLDGRIEEIKSRL